MTQLYKASINILDIEPPIPMHMLLVGLHNMLYDPLANMDELCIRAIQCISIDDNMNLSKKVIKPLENVLG